MAPMLAIAAVSALLVAGLVCADENLHSSALQPECSEEELAPSSIPRALLQITRSIGKSEAIQAGSSRPSADAAADASQGALADARVLQRQAHARASWLLNNVTVNDIDQMLAASSLLTVGGFPAPVLAEVSHSDERTDLERMTVPTTVSAVSVSATTRPSIPSIEDLTLAPPNTRPPTPALANSLLTVDRVSAPTTTRPSIPSIEDLTLAPSNTRPPTPALANSLLTGGRVSAPVTTRPYIPSIEDLTVEPPNTLPPSPALVLAEIAASVSSTTRPYIPSIEDLTVKPQNTLPPSPAPVLAEFGHSDVEKNQESAPQDLLTSTEDRAVPPFATWPPSPSTPSPEGSTPASLGAIVEGWKIDESAEIPHVEQQSVALDPRQSVDSLRRPDEAGNRVTPDVLSANRSSAVSGANFSEAYSKVGDVPDDIFAVNLSVERNRSQQSYASRLDKLGALAHAIEVANMAGFNLTDSSVVAKLQSRDHANASENASHETEVAINAGTNLTDSANLTDLQGRAHDFMIADGSYEIGVAPMKVAPMKASPEHWGRHGADSEKPLSGTFQQLLREAEESDLTGKHFKPVKEHITKAQASCVVVLVIVFTMMYSKMYRERYAYTW